MGPQAPVPRGVTGVGAARQSQILWLRGPAALPFAAVVGYACPEHGSGRVRCNRPAVMGQQTGTAARMTALEKYSRLETTGLWRPGPEAQRINVGVSFGDATLVIFDPAGRPLSHWSLPAIVRLDPGTGPALYAPGSDAAETLEIEDDLMIAAIDRVRAAVARRAPRAGRLRRQITLVAVAALTALAVFWLPAALARQAVALVPEAKRTEIGARLLGHVQRDTGATCRGEVGLQALAALARRLFGPEAVMRILVVPGDLTHALDLPGGIIVLDRGMIEEARDPAVVAGHVLAAIAGRGAPDTLSPIVAGAGFMGTMRLLTTGDLPAEVLQAHADALVRGGHVLPPVATAVAVFGRADVPITPWAEDVDPGGAASAALRAADPLAGRPGTPVLSDDDWISLRAICRT